MTRYQVESREQRAWYLARHAAQYVLEQRADLPEIPGNPNYFAGYVAAAVCYRHLLTTEQFDGITEPWIRVVGPL
ncbi:hypothetical protein [Actinoplanes sp. L3-i22]|uniref:hypothetical protein n=1 Tax=Actinoplanes sp. L3-i22 TaxID=2836373 RepID=UPI001C859B73|nr:hypothetical protein [Actinoplanes sp. L3-i22]